jgi:hypothetical protein
VAAVIPSSRHQFINVKLGNVILSCLPSNKTSRSSTVHESGASPVSNFVYFSFSPSFQSPTRRKMEEEEDKNYFQRHNFMPNTTRAGPMVG